MGTSSIEWRTPALPCLLMGQTLWSRTGRVPAAIPAPRWSPTPHPMADPNIIKRLPDATVDPTPGSTPEKLAEFVKRELAKWASITKASGAQID